MPIQDDIRAIATAESGEDVRGAIISAIQDLNTNGGNAQTLNGYNSDYFTKKAEFDKFVDDEVGQIHQVLDAINRGTTLKVLDLKTYTIGPEAGRLDITVPSSVKDRALLTVDDFYADIVSVSSGSGQNASWVKNASYDSAIGVYHYIYGAIASEITLHFYVKRASAIPVPDYDVHPLSGALTENRTYTADPGEAWSAVTVDVPTGGKTERTLTATENKTYRVPDDRTVWNEVVVAVPIPEPQLQVGSASITSDTFHRTFEPESGKDGFSSFTVDVNVDLNLDYQEIDVNSINFSERVLPRSGFNGLSEVRITSSLELEDPITVRQNGPISLSYGKVGFSEVTVAVPVPVVETGRSVTYSSGGTYTVNPTGNNDAMDSVEVTVDAPVIQQTKSVTLTQSGTVTITPDPNYNAMEEVVVTVSGGGGDCNFRSQAEWDALSLAEKKALGLTVVREDAAQSGGYWYNLAATAGVVDILKEFLGSAAETVSLAAQYYEHLIYFQSKWRKGADKDNGLINHTNITYDSMDHGSETIFNVNTQNPLTTYNTAILHGVRIGESASLIVSNGYYGVTDSAFAIAVPFNSDVEIISEYFGNLTDVVTTSKMYDYVLFIASKKSYNGVANGTYDISAGTRVQTGTMVIDVGGYDKPAVAVYSNVPSGTTITLGTSSSDTEASVVAIGINEVGNTYLPYSSNQICEAHINNFYATSNSWGTGNNPLVLSNTLTANSDGVGVDINANGGDPDYVYCDLGAVNTNFTAYLVVKYSTYYNGGRLIDSAYSNAEAFIRENSLTQVSGGTYYHNAVFGTDHTSGDYIVIALRNNNNTVSVFKNGVKGTDQTNGTAGQYIALGSSYPYGNTFGANITVAFAGVVSEAESDSVVSANIASLMNRFNIS